MKNQIKNIQSLEELQKLFADTFGKNGTMTARLKQIRDLDNDARVALNAENSELRDAFKVRQAELESEKMLAGLATQHQDAAAAAAAPRAEIQSPARLHVLSRAQADFRAIFESLGYSMRTGPQVEDDWHNFTALNTPAHHPARDMQDTFWTAGGNVLRTQTSAVQIRTMETEGVPVKIFCPGTVYRKEMDATHSPMFHQVEGLNVGENITMTDLMSDLSELMRRYFNLDDAKLRFRPSYFPFTEPSLEYDLQWDKKTGTLGTGNDWLEIGGAGMVHPNVLKNCGVDPERYQGFAFGFGLDRLAMLKDGLNDLRKFYDGDIRWLKGE
ncbi:MAG: phenylalanine--tRNA ligase subunit alpha [Rickettsiales bacterium]|nr:phenylalanine--tRNA ligase subunit alpha [Rickettsiales bacterium]